MINLTWEVMTQSSGRTIVEGVQGYRISHWSIGVDVSSVVVARRIGLVLLWISLGHIVEVSRKVSQRVNKIKSFIKERRESKVEVSCFLVRFCLVLLESKAQLLKKA